LKIIKTRKVVDPNVKLNFFYVLISSFFFAGYFPVASGTFGSLAAMIPFFIKGFENSGILLPAIIAMFIAGMLTAGHVMKRYGNDPSVIVIDEVVGMWITVLVFSLVSGMKPGLTEFALLFILFRIFDVVKLQPARYFDNKKNALGVMMDDVVSGVYAGLSAFLILILKIQLTGKGF